MEYFFTDVLSTNWGKKIGTEQVIIVGTEKPSFGMIDSCFYKRI